MWVSFEYIALLVLIGISGSTSQSFDSDDAIEATGFDQNYTAGADVVKHDKIQSCNISLNLNNFGLTSLPDRFIESEHLTNLTLENNAIRSISDSNFESVPNLRHLSLANNPLGLNNLETFSKLANLETLNLNGMTIDGGLPLMFEFSSRLPSLTRLYLLNTEISSFVHDAGALPSLTHLHITDRNFENNFSQFWAELSTLTPALTHLYLKNSDIYNFRISVLPNLTSLSLDRNQIQFLCNSHCYQGFLRLYGISNLESLSVSGNKISGFERDAFSDAKNLVSLDLSGNDIQEMRDGLFYDLHKLKHLDLSENKLSAINEHALDRLSNLEILSLNDNLLFDIDSSVFTTLTSLLELYLDGNRLTSIESGTFSNLIRLRKLSMARNWIKNIPAESLPSSISLETLDLSNNLFENVKDTGVTNSTGVSLLILKENPFITIGLQWLRSMRSDMNIVFGNDCYSRKPPLPSRIPNFVPIYYGG